MALQYMSFTAQYYQLLWSESYACAHVPAKKKRSSIASARVFLRCITLLCAMAPKRKAHMLKGGARFKDGEWFVHPSTASASCWPTANGPLKSMAAHTWKPMCNSRSQR